MSIIHIPKKLQIASSDRDIADMSVMKVNSVKVKIIMKIIMTFMSINKLSYVPVNLQFIPRLRVGQQEVLRSIKLHILLDISITKNKYAPNRINPSSTSQLVCHFKCDKRFFL